MTQLLPRPLYQVQELNKKKVEREMRMGTAVIKKQKYKQVNGRELQKEGHKKEKTG